MWKVVNLLMSIYFSPGLILHELGHFLACKVTSTEIRYYQIYGLNEDWKPEGTVVPEDTGRLDLLVITAGGCLLPFSALLLVLYLFWTGFFKGWTVLVAVHLCYIFLLSSVPSTGDLRQIGLDGWADRWLI